MGIIECPQPASKSSWDSQDFGDISMMIKMAHFRKSTGPRCVKVVYFIRSAPIVIPLMIKCIIFGLWIFMRYRVYQSSSISL